MNDTQLTVKTFIAEEKAAEVTELGIVLALIVAGAVAAIVLIGPKITQYYADLNAQLP
jgi:Flp pilus assembly pilin Flp